MALISNAPSQAFSAVTREHLAFQREVHGQSSEEYWHNEEIDSSELRRLLMSVRNVKTLRAEDGLAEKLSRCLRLEDGGLPLELLTELEVQELVT